MSKKQNLSIKNMTTKQIDPLYHNQSTRTEFMLGNQKYLPTLRLAFLGVDLSPNANNGNARYVGNAGCYALIKNIFLYDGSILIDKCQNLPMFMAFDNIRMGNSKQRSMNNDLSRNTAGFYVDVGLDADGYTQYRSTNVNVIPTKVANATGRLELDRVLLSLRTCPLLQFNDLRVVIEWQQDATQVFVQVPPAYVIARPALIADWVDTDMTFQPFEYLSMEVDSMVIPAIVGGAGAPQNHYQNRINGFNNKRVNNLLVATLPGAGYANPVNLKLVSHAQYSEQIQFYLNNTPVFNDYVKEKNKLAYTEDVFGKLCLVQGTQFSKPGDADHIASGGAGGQFGPGRMISTQSFLGFSLAGKQVNDLSIDYSRVAGPNAQQQSELITYIFAEVNMLCGKNDSGSTVVGYAP